MVQGLGTTSETRSRGLRERGMSMRLGGALASTDIVCGDPAAVEAPLPHPAALARGTPFSMRLTPAER